jgi:hypothetical protein
MPSYPGTANSTTPVISPPNFLPGALFPGDSTLLFNAEQPASPQASVAVYLPVKEGGPAPAISVEVLFSGAPGAFSVQVQEASTDADGFYITPAASAYTISAVNANNVARADFIPTGGGLVRVLLTRTNAVNCTVKVQRLS